MENMLNKEKIWTRWCRQYITSSASNSEDLPQIIIKQNNFQLINSSDLHLNGGVYMLYGLSSPRLGHTPENIRPFYVGKANSLISRIKDHISGLNDTPENIDSIFDGDGNLIVKPKYHYLRKIIGSSNKCYLWFLDSFSDVRCPYSYETNRHDLEKKLIGLICHQDDLRNTLANQKDGIPHKCRHDRLKNREDWVEGNKCVSEITASSIRKNSKSLARDNIPSKIELWNQWVQKYILSDICSEGPTPLFDTDAKNRVNTYQLQSGRIVLKRHRLADRKINHIVKKFKSIDKIRGNKTLYGDTATLGTGGALYVMYKLKSDSESATPEDIIPLYIGKSEAHQWKPDIGNETSNSLISDNLDNDLRWAYSEYYHIGDLSEVIKDGASSGKYAKWAREIFYNGTRKLKDDVYLWMIPWTYTKDAGPYQDQTLLAEVENHLIHLASEAFGNRLLNVQTTNDRRFEAAADWPAT